MKKYLLFETAAGYGLYLIDNWDQIGNDVSVDELVASEERFTGTVRFKAFQPFKTAQEALENMRSINEGEATLLLCTFLSQNLPQANHKLLVVDKPLAISLSQKGFNVSCEGNVLELLRGCRMYETKRLTKLASGGSTFEMNNFQVGLGHSYSRSKLKLDPAKQDKPIINSVSLLDTLTKNVNSFAMRVREWYGWHFPELCKVVTDNIKFCEAVKLIQRKDAYDFGDLAALTELLGEETAAAVKKAARHSIGHELPDIDLKNILSFADNVIKLDGMRTRLSAYLNAKVANLAPNLNTVVGSLLSGRLISHAGSLINLAKAPASTIQILGAEKALFRALKSRSKTPKYGLLFQSSFIGKATNRHKGKAARYLANKCALAARLDYFCEVNSDVYGKKMLDQLGKRMDFLMGGPQHEKNIDVMREAHEEYKELSKLALLNAKTEGEETEAKQEPKARAKKKPRPPGDGPQSQPSEAEAGEVAAAAAGEAGAAPAQGKKAKKPRKPKAKAAEAEAPREAENSQEQAGTAAKPKKRKLKGEPAQ